MTEISYFGNAMERMNMSARAYDRILEVVRQPPEGSERVQQHHIMAAHQPHRNLDRPDYLSSSVWLLPPHRHGAKQVSTNY